MDSGTVKSIVLKWLHFDYNKRAFWIHVSVVVSHKLSLNPGGFFGKDF